MFRNPFEDLGKPRNSQDEWEDVSGAFACQERGCYDTVREAKYHDKQRLLTWKCKDGHTNKVEDFHVD